MEPTKSNEKVSVVVSKDYMCRDMLYLYIHTRWMKSWGIQIASESKVRGRSEELVVNNIEGEEAPFCFPSATGVNIRPAPLVYVGDLIEKIIQLLNQNESIKKVISINNNTSLLNRLSLLTWHDGLIPAEQVWVKIGGDKRGTTLKASFQLCNVERPNSVHNICVFAVFEARDSPTNLHRYREQIRTLQTMQWK